MFYPPLTIPVLSIRYATLYRLATNTVPNVIATVVSVTMIVSFILLSSSFVVLLYIISALPCA